MNLAEYGQIDMRWYWELRAALVAFRDGQSQGGDVRRRMAEEIARRQGIGVAG
jgi:hypothetical protein